MEPFLNRCYVSAFLLILTIAMQIPVRSGAAVREALVSTKIMGEKYQYQYRVYAPPREIHYLPLDHVRNDTAWNALRSMYSLMKAGRFEDWRKFWIRTGSEHLWTVPAERYRRSWKNTLRHMQVVRYEITYNNYIIFRIESDGGGWGRTLVLTRAGKRYFATNALVGDWLKRVVGLDTFDVETGRYVIKPTVHYAFEKIAPMVGDSSTVLARRTDAMRNASPHGLVSGPGVLGKAGLFDGTAWVTLPPAPSLYFSSGGFVIDLWVKPEPIPLSARYESASGGHAATILSRGSGRDEWGMLLQVRRAGAGATGGYRLFYRLGGGRKRYERSAKIEIGQWSHVQVRYDEKGVEMRLNGKPAALEHDPARGERPVLYQALHREPLVLGGVRGKRKLRFVGSIDEVRIWHKAVPWEHIADVVSR